MIANHAHDLTVGPVTILQGDALDRLSQLPSRSVRVIVTSPPYWGLRDYGVEGQLGLEPTPEEYIGKMVPVFRECRRVLADDGTLWVNVGDSYAAHGAGSYGKEKMYGATEGRKRKAPPPGLKPKDLVGIPWMLAFALRCDGWYLRQDIIWAKPNPMPESVTDRCTRAHEYLFMFAKSRRYFYNAAAIRTEGKPYVQKEPTGWDSAPGSHGTIHRTGRTDKQRGHSRRHSGFNGRWDKMTLQEQQAGGANKRSVWTIAPSGFKEAHFATFPEKLVEPCILAGSEQGDAVLDPFGGVMTSGLVAAKLGREAIMIEINLQYINIGVHRLTDALGLFATSGGGR